MDAVQPRPQIGQSVAAAKAVGVQTRGHAMIGERKAVSVVFDIDNESIRRRIEKNPDFRRGGMFYDVVQRFFEREEDIVTHFRGDWKRRQLHW